jgi:predicted peptidase
MVAPPASSSTPDGRWAATVLAGLPCRVLLPPPAGDGEAGQAGVPLVLALHGSGERGDDNVAQLRNGLAFFARADVRRRHRCLVVAPQAPRGSTFGGSWYGGPSPLQERIVALVDEVSGRFAIDRNRVYGVGFSMGAIGLWDIARRHRDVFAAIVPVAGDVDADDDHVAAFARFPVWAVCGAQDELVPPARTRALLARLVPGGVARYSEVHHLGHDVWRFAFGHLPLWDWVFAQKRAP